MTTLLVLHYHKQSYLLEVEGPFQTVLSKKMNHLNLLESAPSKH